MVANQRNFQQKIERAFEILLWKSRLIVILAVIFSALGALSLFVLGSREMYHVFKEIFPFTSQHPLTNEQVLIGVIGAIDLYLIGIVLLLFSFGIYELFISRIDIARLHEETKILEIESLDELKNKLLKVILMVLIVSFFKTVLIMKFNTPLEMLYYALSIVALAGGVYLIHKKEEGD